MKKTFQERILESGIFQSNIFVLPQEKKDEILKETLLEYELLFPVFTFQFPDAGNVTASVYFPYPTSDLLKKYEKDFITVLDMIYSIMLEERSIVTMRVVSDEINQYLHEQGFLENALVAMFFDEYAILPEKIKNHFCPVAPETYIKSGMN